MTSTTITTLDRADASRRLITPVGWTWIVVLSLLFMAFHYVFLRRTLMFATTDNNWSHAMIVPLISIFFIYQNRERLLDAPRGLCWWGLPVLMLGLGGYAASIYPVQNTMFQGYNMILGLFGLVLFLLGTGAMRVLWFPILYLVFAVKVSDRIWEQVAFQLQQIAAVGSYGALQFFTPFIDGFYVDYRGSTLDLTYGGETNPLNVAEACSGLRMLMAFLALGTAMAFLFARPWWQRLVMVSMTVPIAVLINVTRVTVLGLLYLIDPGYVQGDFHTFVGMLMLIPAALLFLLMGWVMDRIVIREERSADAVPATGRSTQRAGHENETQQLREANDPKHIGRFAALGVAFAGTTALLYVSVLAGMRPDLLLENMPGWLGYAGAAVAGLVLVALAFQLPRWMPAREGRRTLARQTAAASLVAGILVASLVGQRGVLAMTQAVLFKEPVVPRHSLMLLPERLGSWERVRDDPPLSREMVEELGTQRYLSRWYRDTDWPSDEPGGIIRLHVAYYTGTVDTVPHVPERCFVAGGLRSMGQGMTTLALTGDRFEPDPVHGGYLHPATLEPTVRIPQRDVRATIFTFAQPDRPERQENVVYFFAANGQFMATPDQVRIEGFDPRDRHSYYCKVELQMWQVGDPELAARRAAAFLDHALPDLMAVLPDWVDVVEGRYPAGAATSDEQAGADR